MAERDDMKKDLEKISDDVKDGARAAGDRVAEAGAELKSAASKAMDDGKKVVDQALDKGGDLADEAADALEDGKEVVKSAARKAVDTVKETAEDGADMARDALASSRDALAATGAKVAETLRSAADKADLRGMQDSVTEAVTATAEALRDTRAGDMAVELRDCARRNPGMFILGAAVAGFAIGCWMQSSATRSRSDDLIRRLRS